MGRYFDYFPKIAYDIKGKRRSEYNLVTNIVFRLRFVREALQNIAAYYPYIITDNDTPEILAEKVYGHSEAHWIILLANNIVDPQYDWPMNERTFTNYIIGKYTSIEAAQTTIHHYEKVVNRTESLSGIQTETRFEVNQAKLTDNSLTVPYDYYQGTGSLADTAAVATYNLENGRTVTEITSRDAISYYDWEASINDAKREIKLIKPEYYSQIMNEFDQYTEISKRIPYIRRLR
jgi:hypothetical protein